jgi:hypothetical protein
MQCRNEKAAYGSQLLDQLTKDLSERYGKGFSRSNVFQIRQFYLRFSKIQTLSGQFENVENQLNKLSWSHYIEILKADSDLEISFYAKQSEKENWSVRELKRQMQSVLFHRLALSKDKKGNQLFISKYQLYLPDKKQIENELNKLLDNEE